jgi:hypothetical protein
MGSLSFADGTDLEIHHQSAIDRINNEEELYNDDTRPGAFNVSYEGIDPELNGPKFHVTFVSNEQYSSYSDWVNRFDLTTYVDGMLDDGYVFVNNGTSENDKVFDDNGNYTQTINYDFYLTYPNPDDLELSHIHTFGLTRYSQRGYIMFVINEVEFEVEYIPTDDEELIKSQKETPVIEDVTDTDDKKQNSNIGRIFSLIGGLGAGIGAAILLKRRKKVKIYKKKKEPKPKPKKKNILTKITDGVKKIGQKAVDGLQYVSKGINKGYESLKKVGINTRFGRIEVGDVVGLTGADQIMKVNKTINDLCDVINQKKDISKLYKNMIDHLINSKIGKLKSIIGRGLKVDVDKIRKLVNIEKEINVIKGLIKDGVSTSEIFDLNEKRDRYRNTKTSVENYYEKFNGAKKRLDKGINIEGSNIKKALKGVG